MTIVAYGFGLSPNIGSVTPAAADSLNDTGIVNRNLSRRIHQVLYSLKRLWGGSFTIYQMGDATVNHLDGQKTIPRTVTHIRRGLIIPGKNIRDVEQTISMISANKAFVMGGSYDISARTFIIDRKDAPNLELTESDWIVFDNRRYEVMDFQELEFDSAWIVSGRAVEGDIPAQIRLLCADNLIRVSQGADQT